jgi:hypothetical protein
MVKTSLVCAAGTPDEVKRMAQAVPPYDLLKAYREGSQKLGSTDLILVIAMDRGEAVSLKAWRRVDFVEQAPLNEVARRAHPIARESAHKKMKIPPAYPAFWLGFEMDGRALITCAIGSYRYNEKTTDGPSILS